MTRPPTKLLTSFALLLLAAAAVLAAACDSDSGPPFACGGMTCAGNEACVHETDTAGRNDYVCKEDRMCASPGTDYCPGADSSFCRRDVPDAGADTDAGARAVTTVECRYRAP